PAPPNATANAAPQAPRRAEAPNAARGAGAIWQQRGDHPNASHAPAANANLAPHPTPPSQPSREAAHAAPNTPNARTTPAQRNLAQHPTPPQVATQPPRAEHAGRQHAAPANAPPHAASAQPQQPA